LKHWGWRALGWSVALAFVWTGTALFAVQSDAPAVHTYNILFFDGEQISLQGTEIRTAGFCVEVLLGDRVDTIVCQVRYITEAIEDGGAPARRAEPLEG
jgi:hypothetical protein